MLLLLINEQNIYKNNENQIKTLSKWCAVAKIDFSTSGNFDHMSLDVILDLLIKCLRKNVIILDF